MRDRLWRLAEEVRGFMTPVWASWQAARGAKPEVLSTNTCVRTSLFLSKAIQADGLAAVWTNNIPRTSEDGPDLGPYGFLAKGRWESHAWVVSEGFIVDITADQFGDAPVIVTPLGDPRYGPFGVDLADPGHQAERQAAVAALWPQWLARSSR